MDYFIPPIKLSTGRIIGKGHPAYVIAEIGSNHDGDLERAKQLIGIAKQAGADAAKFQSFSALTLLNPTYKSNGQWKPDPSWSTIERLTLPLQWHQELYQEAARLGIDFLSTPFDLERLQLLVDLGVPAIKIASGDLTYLELIRAAGQSGKAVFLSTGHATLGEVEGALKVLWETGCKDIALFHCASVYPADFKDANLHAMRFMHKGFQVLVGCSDHTPGSTVPIGAIALGANIIEKHLTDDKTREGPDHSYALNGEEFAQMIRQIRQLESALVGGIKSPRPSEEMERIMARRALYANEKILKGTPLERKFIKIVRHCYSEGISADQLDRVRGKVAKCDIEENALITWDMI